MSTDPKRPKRRLDCPQYLQVFANFTILFPQGSLCHLAPLLLGSASFRAEQVRLFRLFTCPAELPKGVLKRAVVHLCHEVDDVAMFAAAEAVKGPLIDLTGCRLFAVERATDEAAPVRFHAVLVEDIAHGVGAFYFFNRHSPKAPLSSCLSASCSRKGTQHRKLSRPLPSCRPGSGPIHAYRLTSRL